MPATALNAPHSTASFADKRPDRIISSPRFSYGFYADRLVAVAGRAAQKEAAGRRF
jgi:hypothetical protein